jgi:heme/copper-type cytochrome/quinol oxidase subunit 1
VNRAQKVSVSIAVAAALFAGTNALLRLMDETSSGGWFMYSPNSAPMFSPSRGPVLRDLAFWLAAIAAWLLVAWRLFRSKPD